MESFIKRVIKLQEHFESVNLEHTNIPQLANLSAVEQLDLSCSLVEIVAERDAVAPFLDFSAFRPELDVNGVARFEHLAKRGDMYRLSHIN